MFKDKIIKNKNKRQCRIFKVLSSKTKVKKVKIISKRLHLSEKQFQNILKIIESDLRNDDFNYKGRTRLEIQLLLDVANENKIELRKKKFVAIVIIH